MHKPFLLLMAALMALVAVFSFTAPTTQAASQTINLNFSGSGSTTSILSALAVCDECAPDAFFTDPTGFINTWGFGVGANITAQASWNNPAPVGLQYTAANLRHGATLDLTDTLTPGAGTIGVNYSVTGIIGLYGSHQSGSLSCAILTVTPATCNGWLPTGDTLTLGPISGSDNIPCTMPLPGESPRDCTNTKTITLWNANLFDFVSVGVDLILDEKVTVTGSGVTTLRIAVINGGPAITNNPMTFSGTSPSTVPDPISISCSEPVGNDLMYSLTSNSYTAEPATYTGDVKLSVSASAFGIGGTFTTPALVTSSGADLGPISLGAPDQQVDLGPVLKNSTPPVVNANGPYTGVEGSPVTFNSTGTSSVCGSPTLVWNFSDGGVAYGASPQHTFVDNGVYSGLLTATDSDGNVATTTFSVTISNVNPTVDAGPDQQNDWGRTIFFHANGADAGAIDNGSLLYTWNFNDPFDPLGASGQDVTHVYSQPGTYVPVVTVHDKDGGTGTDSLTVTITKRDVTVSYLGGSAAQIGDTVPLSASIVDEYGQPVVGRLVTFTLDGSPIGSALTNTFGIAQTSFIVATATGAHTIVASFAGDALYKPGASSGTSTNFSVSKASAIFTYLGGLNGSPSKPLVLTSKLLDQNGKPVAGKLVTMAVGSQSCSAITNPSGIASCTITKLTQKPGKYLLSLNFGGTADYNSAGLTAVFTIGNANG